MSKMSTEMEIQFKYFVRDCHTKMQGHTSSGFFLFVSGLFGNMESNYMYTILGIGTSLDKISKKPVDSGENSMPL